MAPTNSSSLDTKRMYAFTNDNRFQSSSLFEQQVEQLLKELNTVVKEKWPQANNDCVDLIKKIFDSYAKVFQASATAGDGNEDDDGQESGEDDAEEAGKGAADQERRAAKRADTKRDLKRFKQIDSIKHINELGEKLTARLGEFDAALGRLRAIKQNIAKMIESKSSHYLNDLNQLVDFNKLLASLLASFEKELKLKQLLINDDYVFKSRANRNMQVTLLCCFMHQPYLDEYALNKFLVVFNNRNIFLKEK